MGKKTTATDPAAPAKRAAKTKPAAAKVAVLEPVAAAPAAPKRKASPAAAKKAPARAKKPSYTHDDIALRAYFIAEKRQAAGLPGDPHQDWVDAERQLAAEAATASKSKVRKA